jgi:hypothetical protein
MLRLSTVLIIMVLLGVTACAYVPTGPSVMVLPGSGMSFEQFRNDDYICQQFALSQVGGTTASQAAVNSGVTSAAVGTALGAAAGAALGGGHGAVVGAGTGLVGGSLIGTGAASSSMYDAQQRYDVAYIQCMYAKGHQVPVSGQFSGETSRRSAPPQSSYIPPPPPGSPPPTPSR